jgi:phospholipase C
MKVGLFLAALSLVFFAAGGCAGGPSTLGVMPGPGSTSTPQPGISKIQHIVIIVQENRSVDNLFNGFPGADTVTSGLDSTGATIPLVPTPLEVGWDPRHLHNDFLGDYDDGAMNGWNLEGINPNPGFTAPPDGAYGFVPHAETKPYFVLAKQFVFADEMFQSNQGPSFPAHQYLISGSSVPETGSQYKVSENIVDSFGGGNGGCDAPPKAFTYLIDSQGNETQTIFPCLDRQTIGDLLDAKHMSWRYYTPSATYLFSAIDAVRHLRYGPDWAFVTVPETTIYNDIAGGTLPAVSWVVPISKNSDHSGSQANDGPSWVVSITNAIGASKYWNSTAIFVTWDDWGGWYDHVPPKILNSYELGFRVPLIVVSPYAKAGYVSHTPHEFGSILRFTEEALGLGSLGYTDSRADDLSDCFNFSQSPLPYVNIKAPYSKSYILSHWVLAPPDND